MFDVINVIMLSGLGFMFLVVGGLFIWFTAYPLYLMVATKIVATKAGTVPAVKMSKYTSEIIGFVLGFVMLFAAYHMFVDVAAIVNK